MTSKKKKSKDLYRIGSIIIALIIAVGGWWFADGKDSMSDSASAPPSSSAGSQVNHSLGSYDSMLSGLKVSKPLSSTGYSGKKFHWPGSTSSEDVAAAQKDGLYPNTEVPSSCNTKEVIRIRDAENFAWTDKKDCEFTGNWTDGYGKREGGKITYQKGTDPSKFDIEHIVARSNAWISGASKWTDDQRERFANDPLELVVSGYSPNRSKGEQAADTYIPVGTWRCNYIYRQVAVKHKYELSITPLEKEKLESAGNECGLT